MVVQALALEDIGGNGPSPAGVVDRSGGRGCWYSVEEELGSAEGLLPLGAAWAAGGEALSVMFIGAEGDWGSKGEEMVVEALVCLVVPGGTLLLYASAPEIEMGARLGWFVLELRTEEDWDSSR